MAQETFENNIRKKFENQTKTTPTGVWEGIENTLNAEFVASYQTHQNIYKWASIAAILIAVILLGILMRPAIFKNSESTTAEETVTGAYNALLADDFDYGAYYHTAFTGAINNTLLFSKPQASGISRTSKALPILSKRQSIKGPRQRLASVGIPLETASTNQDIHRYHTLSSQYAHTIQDEPTVKSNAMWAGIEAGAGTFESGIGNNVIADALNPLELASALGSGTFINPTTSVSENMGQAISTSIALDFGIQLGKKWTLESGVAYTSVENSGTAAVNVLDVFSISDSNLDQTRGLNEELPVAAISGREASLEVQNTYDYNLNLNNTVRFASLPVQAGYFLVNNRFSMRLNAGLSANYLVEGQLTDPTSEIVNTNEINPYNEWSFDGLGGIAFGYSIFEKLDVTIVPNYRHAITPISNTISNPSRFVLQTGVRYTIR